MIDWLYRYRDPSAVATSALCLGLAWALLHAPRTAPASRPLPDEVVVSLQREPEPEPPAPAPPPTPMPMPTPTPAKPPEPKPITPPPPAPAKQSPTPTPTRTPEPVPDSPRPLAAPTQTAAPSAEPAAPASPTATAAPRAPQATVAAPSPPAPPVETPPAPRPPATGPASDDSYKATLRGHLERVKRYPTSREARQLRPAGTVRLALEIGRDGSLLSAQVEASSGSPLLDSEALRTVRNTRFPPFPPDAYAGQNSHRFFVPIEYRLAEE